MDKNFEQSLAWVLQSEGGYVDDPEDPGGATNKGVTQAVYDTWRQAHNLPTQNVRDISDGEVEAIYRNRYWDAVSGDNLPSGLDYATFDFAVNSGVKRAATYLQNILGVTPDGHIGPVTCQAASERVVPDLIDDLCTDRLNFLESLPTYPHFGVGWSNRVKTVRARAKGLAQ